MRHELTKYFPIDWTPIKDLNYLRLGFALKLIGYDWRKLEDIAPLLAFMTKEKLLEINNRREVRINPVYAQRRLK